MENIQTPNKFKTNLFGEGSHPFGSSPIYQVFPKLYFRRIWRQPTRECGVDSIATIDEPIVDGELTPQRVKREKPGRDTDPDSRGILWEESTTPKKDRINASKEDRKSF